MNISKAYYALINGEKLPRKTKKFFLGKKLSSTKLKKLLDSVEIIKTAETMYQSPIIKPYAFCPNCGCIHSRGTGNLTSYPEHWEYFYCLRCNKKVGVIDNSPFYHALEFKEDNYKID